MELGGTQQSMKMLLSDLVVVMLSKSEIHTRFRDLEPKYSQIFFALDDAAVTLALYQCSRL